MNSSDALQPEHRTWLERFAAAVRNCDFATGQSLCDEGIVAFGTVSFHSEGLANLRTDQWEAVWNRTRGFDFDYASARAVANDGLTVLVATWQSTGIQPAGGEFPRRGRATIVLQQSPAGWRAVHTHFSLAPVMG